MRTLRMHRYKEFGFICALLAIFCIVGLCPAQSSLSPASAAAQTGPPPAFDLSRMIAGKLNAYAKEDAENPPPPGGIVFAGSSIFALWSNLKDQMAPLPVLNRAISGTKTYQQLEYMDRLVLKHRPKIIVYYCGSNDVNEGAAAASIADNFRKFVDRVAAGLPDTKIVFASINRAPQKKDRWSLVDEANARVKAYCEKSSRVLYIDLNTALFDSSGNPRLELYQPDRLHFKAPAYEEFTKILKPLLQQLWGEIAGDAVRGLPGSGGITACFGLSRSFFLYTLIGLLQCTASLIVRF